MIEKAVLEMTTNNYFCDLEQERQIRSTLSAEDNHVLDILLNPISGYTERQIDAYIELMQDSVDVRLMLNPILSNEEIHMLGDLISQGYDITGYAELLDKMNWLDVERELLTRKQPDPLMKKMRDHIFKNRINSQNELDDDLTIIALESISKKFKK